MRKQSDKFSSDQRTRNIDRTSYFSIQYSVVLEEYISEGLYKIGGIMIRLSLGAYRNLMHIRDLLG